MSFQDILTMTLAVWLGLVLKEVLGLTCGLGVGLLLFLTHLYLKCTAGKP